MAAGQSRLHQPIGDGQPRKPGAGAQIGPADGLWGQLIDLPGIQRVAEPEIFERRAAHQIGVGIGFGQQIAPALEPGDCFT